MIVVIEDSGFPLPMLFKNIEVSAGTFRYMAVMGRYIQELFKLLFPVTFINPSRKAMVIPQQNTDTKVFAQNFSAPLIHGS